MGEVKGIFHSQPSNAKLAATCNKLKQVATVKWDRFAGYLSEMALHKQ
jgi:hypothetical protein